MEEVVSMPNSGGGAFQAMSTAKTRLPLQGCEDYLKAPLLPRPGPCACLCASTCPSNLVGPGQVLRFSLLPSALLIWYLEFCRATHLLACRASHWPVWFLSQGSAR